MQRADKKLVSHMREHVSETVSLHTQSDMLGHMPSSSLVAPLNHAYLCMDVPEHTIRPQIISFSDGSLKDGSKTAANQHSTFSNRTAGDSRARLVANSEESLANPGVTTPPAEDVSYIDLGNCDQKCRYCGCLFWYAERLKGAKLCRTARDRCSVGDIPGMKIRLYSKGGIRGYELSSSDLLGGIVFEDGPKSRMDFDVIIQLKGDIPDPVYDPTGYKVVTELMMHGPCGVANPGAACTENIVCSKKFPKKYNDNTFFDTNGYTHYRRRQTKIHFMKGESRLDNCNVVPYNQKLSLVFHAYINVEYCGWSMLMKYFFKYISKGPDRILAKVSKPIGDTSTSTDKQYLIHCREPAVQILNVHLENMQRVSFRNKDKIEIIVNMPEKKKTTLTEWYVYNNQNTDGRHLTYLDFPSEFAWSAKTKSWHRRVI
nr:DNA helicase [Tanacetum cinerariifolium]